MAFRGEDQNYRWPRHGLGRDERHRRANRDDDAENSLSLSDTLRELAVTILGFLGVIALIVAVVSLLRG